MEIIVNIPLESIGVSDGTIITNDDQIIND